LFFILQLGVTTVQRDTMSVLSSILNELKCSRLCSIVNDIIMMFSLLPLVWWIKIYI